ncbi:hypothetical protein JW905_00685 [bacterium]|nr:hypothetical protein [candidate division CSSED10-310 bacterium]
MARTILLSLLVAVCATGAIRAADAVPMHLIHNAAAGFQAEGAAWYPEWRQAHLAEPVAMEDLAGTITAYLFPVLDTRGFAGYITISAVYDYSPLIEYTRSTELFDRIQSLSEEGRTPVRLLFLGPFRYYIEVLDGNEPAVLRTGDLHAIDAETLRLAEQTYHYPDVRVTEEAAGAWDRLATGTFFGESRAVRRIANALPCYWYRGCGPTTITIMLLCYGGNGYPNLYEERSRQTWCSWGRTTAWNLHDEVANRCGLPVNDCDYGYGVTIYQMSNAFTATASAHGYNFSATNDFNPTYNEYQAEINQDDPVGLAVYDDGGPSGYDSHAICGFGYDFGAQHNAILFDTWNLVEHIYALENFVSWNMVRAEPNTQAGPTATPTGNATQPPATSTPTPTPTQPAHTPTPAPPTATPTPTPNMGDDLNIDLTLTQSLFHPGDWFSLDAIMNNPGVAGSYRLIVIFDISSLLVPEPYFFYPSWTGNLEYEVVSLPAGSSSHMTIMAFTWPVTGGFASGLRFWATLMDQNMSIVSNIDSTMFTYSG